MSSSQGGLKSKTRSVTTALEKMFGKPRLATRRAKPLDMLIATLLSQNTNDKNSHRAYRELRKRFPSWSSVLLASTRSIASAIRVGGMANQKSVRIKQILQRIKEDVGTLDLDFLKKKSNDDIIEFLTSFDGVGTKTASCVLLFSLGRDAFPVDTHVHRICGRLGLTPASKSPDHTYEEMKALVPKGKAYSLHINLIQFGRTICRSNNPLCGVCPLFTTCIFKQKTFFKQIARRYASSVDYRFMLLDHV